MEGGGKQGKVVIGQRVMEEKRRLASEMRREMTPMEFALWQKLRRSQLGVNFRRQQVIDGFIADFYCHSAALVVEVDGPIHDATYDAERDHIFSGRGLKTLRFTNEQIRANIGFVLYQIRQHLASASH